MKKGILILVMLLCTHMVAADVLITEVMHSPNNTGSDTDGEWIELYNSGLGAVDLADYKIDGYNFDDFVLSSGEYLIVARELVDGDDEDNESFESVYGNNNGMWDEDFNAVDGYFSLSAEDTVVLSNGETVVDQVTYSNSTMCLERVNDEWQEGVGTPGEGYMQQEEEGIQVSVLVENNVPIIESVDLLTDDAEDAGIQVLPALNGDKEVLLTVNVSDVDSDVQNVTVSISNRSYSLNYSEGVYTGSLFMVDEVAGFYDANVSVCDYEICVYSSVNFEYLGMIVTSLNTSSLSFGNGDEQNIEIVNSGNVVLDFEIGGTDLVAGEHSLSIESFSVYNSYWMPLSLNGVYLDLNVMPGAREDLQLKFELPVGTRSGEYRGVISVIGMQDE